MDKGKTKQVDKMKIKTQDDIINSIDHDYYDDIKKCEEYIQDAFNSFNSCITFYKKYRDNPKLLEKEQKTIYDDYEIAVSHYGGQPPDNFYNNILFDYCFRDMIE